MIIFSGLAPLVCSRKTVSKLQGCAFCVSPALPCNTVGRLWTNSELEVALKISLHSWKFYFCGGKIEEQNIAAKLHGVWRGVPLPFAASFALKLCWSIRKPTRYPCCRRVKVCCYG